MPDEEDVVVAVEPELPLASPDVKVVAPEDAAVGDLKAQFAELQSKADEDRKAREAAEARAVQASQEAAHARRQADSEITDSHLGTVASGISAAEAEASSAEGAYAKAMEEGNFVEAAKAQRRMSRAEAELVSLASAKADIEQRKAAPPRKTSDDPVEAFIAGRTAPTAKWLREHREWIVDPVKNNKLTAAHFNAVGDGLTADTDAYFESVEKFIGLRKVEPPKEPKKTAPPVAPVGRGGNGSSVGAGSNEVRLTKGEAMSATDGTLTWNYSDPSGQNKFKKGDPIGIQEFARRKKALADQGAYDRSYTEQ